MGARQVGMGMKSTERRLRRDRCVYVCVCVPVLEESAVNLLSAKLSATNRPVSPPPLSSRAVTAPVNVVPPCHQTRRQWLPGRKAHHLGHLDRQQDPDHPVTVRLGHGHRLRALRQLHR